MNLSQSFVSVELSQPNFRRIRPRPNQTPRESRNDVVDGSVKSEIIEDPQIYNFLEVVEKDEGEVKVEVNSQQHSQNMGCVAKCSQNGFVPRKTLTIPKKALKINIQTEIDFSYPSHAIVFLDILPCADPRTRKLPLFVLKTPCLWSDPKIYHFKFAEISLDQFKQYRTSAWFELLCSNYPLCKSRILVKSILTADVKSETFATLKNWEIVPPTRDSSFKPHTCNGPIPITIPLASQLGSVISVESAVSVNFSQFLSNPGRHKQRGLSPDSQIMFSIQIKDKKFLYISELNPRILTKGELFSPIIITCVDFPRCESSIEICPTHTVDTTDEDLYSPKNWRILKISEESHQCFHGKRRQGSPQVWV